MLPPLTTLHVSGIITVFLCLGSFHLASYDPITCIHVLLASLVQLGHIHVQGVIVT